MFKIRLLLHVYLLCQVVHSQCPHHQNGSELDVPAGRLIPVYSDQDINDLQDELQPGDAMIMQPGEPV